MSHFLKIPPTLIGGELSTKTHRVVAEQIIVFPVNFRLFDFK